MIVIPIFLVNRLDVISDDLGYFRDGAESASLGTAICFQPMTKLELRAKNKSSRSRKPLKILNRRDWIRTSGLYVPKKNHHRTVHGR